MTRLINVFIVAFFLVLPATASPVDSTHRHSVDTVQYQRRNFDSQKISKYKADPDYRYGRPAEGLTFWDRILFAVFQVIAEILRLATGTALGQIVFYGLCAWLIVYVVLRLLDVQVRDLFFKRSSRRIDFNIANEDIHALDFEKLIAQSVNRKHYRDAVRLTFLFSLKKLSDASLIRWMPGKTNDEYLTELEKHPSRGYLQEMRYYFDYAWYGHFEISDNTYDSVRNSFGKFNETLG